MTPEEMYKRFPVNFQRQALQGVEGLTQAEQTELKPFAAEIKEKYGLEQLALVRDKGDIAIASIAVPESDQGKGKGSAAIQDILNQAKREGVSVKLEPENESLRSFYRTLGFQDVEDGSMIADSGNLLNQLEQTEYQQAVAKGLPMDTESRKARAREIGYDTETVWYHGTGSDAFQAFDPDMVGAGGATPVGRGFFFDKSYEGAEQYGKYNVMETYLRTGKVLEVNAGDSNTHGYFDANHESIMEDFDKGGYDSVRVVNDQGEQMMAVFDPSQIRSVNAAFDPDFADSGNLLAQQQGVEALNQLVYHGSPYKFSKFDHSMMGSGEGAQAYGWGTYLAESLKTAEFYAKTLANNLKIGVMDDVSKHAAGIVSNAGSKEAAIARLTDNMQRYSEATRGHWEDVLDAIKNDAYKLQESNLYEVDLPDEQIAKMLDWDAPLSEQPESVLEAAKRIDPNLSSKEPHWVPDNGQPPQHWTELADSIDDLPTVERVLNKGDEYHHGKWMPYGDYLASKMTGGEFYQEVASGGNWGKQVRGLNRGDAFGKEASEELNKLGIPGIKYWDGGSRAAGEGTRNYVVFDENIITITKRNGEPVTQAEREQVLPESPAPLAQGPVEETDAFKNWAGTEEVIDPSEINYFDFSGEGPFVMRAYHGTTHDITEFDASIKGTKEGQFGAVNYFTSDQGDAAENYAGEGPDLTNRIEFRAEQIESAREIDMDEAREIARQELAGESPQVMELYIRTEKPFVVGTKDSPWAAFVDFEALEKQALEEIANRHGVEASEVEENRDDYEDEIDEARWLIEEDTGNPLFEAIDTVARRYDIDSQELFASVSDYAYEGIRHSKLEEILRGSESLAFAEDPETGELISYHALGEIIQELGFDSIILKNAGERFSNMDIGEGTAHIQIFDENNTNIKHVENLGTFDPTNANIYYQSGVEQLISQLTDAGFLTGKKPINAGARATEAVANLLTSQASLRQFFDQIQIPFDALSLGETTEGIDGTGF
jgi:GNAT superfamily N-acetyltransferase